MRILRSLVLLMVFASLTTSCGADENEGKTAADLAQERKVFGLDDPGPSSLHDNTGLQIEPFDLNQDDVADMWKVFRIERKNTDDLTDTVTIVRKEVDANFDRSVDLFFFYNESQELFREEADLNNDGLIDMRSHYENGRVVKREIYNGRETPDSVKHFRGGVLVKIEHDRDHNGVVDEWEIYSQGRLVQVGYSTDGDDKVDTWETFVER